MSVNEHWPTADKIGRSNAEKVVIIHYILSDLHIPNDPDPYWVGYHNGLGIAIETLLAGEQKTALFVYLIKVSE